MMMLDKENQQNAPREHELKKKRKPLSLSLSSFPLKQQPLELSKIVKNTKTTVPLAPVSAVTVTTTTGSSTPATVPSTPSSSSESVATLLCEKFQAAVWVGFGCVPLGISSTREIRLTNPTASCVRVSVDKCPTKKGFSVAIGEERKCVVSLQPSESVSAFVTWTPVENLSVREIATFMLDGKYRLQLTIHGIAGMGTSKVLVGKDKGDKATVVVHKSSKKQNVLRPILAKKDKQQQSHFATRMQQDKAARKNTSKDEKVEKKGGDKTATKQVASVVEWVNSKVHQQLPDLDNVNDKYSSLMSTQMEEKHRNDFLLILQHEDTVDVLNQVEEEILSNKISLRADRNVRINVGFKDGMVNMLMNYDPFWLKFAMEALFNITIRPPKTKAKAKHVTKDDLKKSNEASWKMALKKIIHQYVLQSNAIEARYSREAVVLTPPIEKNIQECLRHHILSKVLSLIYILDEARMNGMCCGRLNLFRPDAALKSSKEILIELCRSFLQAEGDVIKHMSSLGYHVEFKQSCFHEYNFLCSDITTDFRDGIRLARLVDLLAHTNEHNNVLSSKLRVPAVSRLQKLHNVGVSLQYLREEGIELPVEEKSIVDGCTDAVMILLWGLMFEFELKFVVNIEDIRTEILSIGNPSVEYFTQDDHNCDDTLSFYTQLKASLREWCRSILKVHNEEGDDDENVPPSTSLSERILNGSVLCLLIHHYHPHLMPLDCILDNSDFTTRCEEKTIIYSLQSLSQSNKDKTRRSNLLNLSKALRSLGGVPFMLSTENSTEEKTVVMFLGFLFVRLVLTPMQASITSLMQRKVSGNKTARNSVVHASGRVHHKKEGEVDVTVLRSRRDTASSVIGIAVRGFLTHRRNRESVLMSQLRKRTLAEVPPKKMEEQIIEQGESNANSVCLEEVHMEVVDGHQHISNNNEQPTLDTAHMYQMCMLELLQNSKSVAALKNETLHRLKVEQQLEDMRNFYEASMSTARTTQRELEAKLAKEKKEREQLRINKEVSDLEDMIRMAEEKLLRDCEQYHMANKIKTFFKKSLSRVHLKKQLTIISTSVVKIQAMMRRVAARRLFLFKKAQVIVLQAAVRKYQTEMFLQRKRTKMIDILSTWTLKVVHKTRNAKLVRARTIIQNFLISKLVQKQFHTMKSAARLLSMSWKRYRCRQHDRCHRAAVRIQTCFIKISYNKRFSSRNAAFVVQSIFKKFVIKQTYAKQIQSQNDSIEKSKSKAKVVIATFFRRVMSYKHRKTAALSIEKWFLAYRPLLRSRKLIKGFLRLQAFRRSVSVRCRQSSRVKAMYERIKIANMRALSNPEMRLSVRTQTALLTLQKGKMISHVLKACETLELSTSFSVRCCINFVEASASKILFSLIRSCNRSTPHQELLRCALNVLINVTKDATLAEKVVHNGDTTELLVDLMQMFRDKKMIFNLSCELLTRFVLAQSDIKEECLSADMKKRLDGILHILERKHRLDLRVKSISKAAAAKLSPTSSNYVSTAPPFELMKTFMGRLCQA